MKRYLLWTFGLGLMIAGASAPASAQVHVDIGVRVPNVGARVIVGAPQVVYVPVRRPAPVYAPRVVHPRKRHWDNRRDHRDREYYKDVRDARRDYARDLRDARRDYERDLRNAEWNRRR